jgi:uncharacterized protein (TIGR00162 family)
MKETLINEFSRPKLRNAVLIEGLPGMGYVGKLAADHLIEELHAKKFAEMVSPHFPHHVVVEKDGTLRLPRNEFYWAKHDGRSIVIWTGDVQPISPEGHYEVVEKVLAFVKRLGVKQLFTLGGYATGKYSKAQPRVVGMGAKELMEKIASHGAKVETRGGPIIGAAGLLLGLGNLSGISGACLLGETHGMLVDNRAAQAVLRVLAGTLGLEIKMESLEERARATEQMIERIQREMIRREEKAKRREEEESWYIG